MAFFGDGATSEGDFHEAMNFAGVWQVPLVFVVQNNQWAISVPLKKQTHSRTIAQKALAYGLPGLQVDGNDILAVYAACREAVERARGGDGPTLIECVTYRLGVHTTADDPTKYRSTEEVEAWERKDPLTRFGGLSEKKNLLDDGRDRGHRCRDRRRRAALRGDRPRPTRSRCSITSTASAARAGRAARAAVAERLRQRREAAAPAIAGPPRRRCAVSARAAGSGMAKLISSRR